MEIDCVFIVTDVVGIVTRLRTGRSRNRGSISGKGKRFSYIPRV
jgi:hypothetical protein